MEGRRSLAVVTALLVLLAGCSAFGAGVPNAEQSGTVGGDVDESVSPIYEPPLNTTDVAVKHVLALRKAGTFTYHSTVTISDASMNGSVSYGRLAHVEMETGEIFVTRKEAAPGTNIIYVDGNGTTYVKSIQGTEENYTVTNGTIDTSRYAINGVPRFLDMFELSYDGATTMNGEQVYRYSATSPEQVTSLKGVGASQGASNISAIQATMFVTPDGLITKLGYSMDFETSQGTHTVEAETNYSRLGESAVSAPDWVSDAKAIAQGERYVTRTVTNESLGAELTLTADRTLFDRIRIIAGPGPLYNGDNLYEDAAVSSAVTPLIPPTAENATITLEYDESAIPDGNESAVHLYQYVATRDTWKVVDATQDTEGNTFTFELQNSVALVVMHEPTWEATGNETA